MDPLTHGLVGMALGLQNGGSLSLANGTLVASVIGSLCLMLILFFKSEVIMPI